MREAAAELGLLEGIDEIGEGTVVHAAAALRRGHRETQREVCFPHAGRSEQDDIFFSLDEAQGVETLDLLALEARLKREIEIRERLRRRESRGAHRCLEPAIIAEHD